VQGTPTEPEEHAVIPFICTTCGEIDIDASACVSCDTVGGPEGAAA
jgi:hypothetical protein